LVTCARIRNLTVESKHPVPLVDNSRYYLIRKDPQCVNYFC
jgi:hypothetical protein